jgi:hypothetical protein
MLEYICKYILLIASVHYTCVCVCMYAMCVVVIRVVYAKNRKYFVRVDRKCVKWLKLFSIFYFYFAYILTLSSYKLNRL